MINKSMDRLSRSVSQNDQSERSLAYLRDQSSCSSLTSGIGHSDQSICTDRASTLDQDIDDSHKAIHNHEQQNQDDNISQVPKQSECSPAKTVVPQYLRAPPKKVAGSPNQSSNHNRKSNNDAPGSPNGDEDQDKLRANIKQFVDIIFTDSQSISLEKKAEFGLLMRTHNGRLLFAMFVDEYRVNSKRVSEHTFYSLAQYFSIVLLECLLEEDFRPAKIIMNMMFTYYYEQRIDKIPPTELKSALDRNDAAVKTEIRKTSDNITHPSGQQETVKTYLYRLLKDQEIFKSIRFWTSAFYESVIVERNNHPVFVDKLKGKLSTEKRDEELDCSKNITFGLLGSFIYNMCLLDLSHEFCKEFLNKHSTIAGLSEHQLEMLRTNLESMFEETSDRAPISQVSAAERLATFLHKWGSRLNQSNLQRSSDNLTEPCASGARSDL